MNHSAKIVNGGVILLCNGNRYIAQSITEAKDMFARDLGYIDWVDFEIKSNVEKLIKDVC